MKRSLARIRKHDNTQGFTLIEIMIVVAIIGLLTSIAIPSFLHVREKTMERTQQTNCRQIEAAIARYAMDVGATNGQLFVWDTFKSYLRQQDLNSYTVASAIPDATTFLVGGTVSYE